MNPYFEVILRTCAVYIFIVLAIRLFGKKELSQLSVTDLVFIMLISNSVQNAMVGSNVSLLGGIIAAGALFILNSLLKLLSYRSKAISKFLQGEPVMLIHDGNIIDENLWKEKITIRELEAAAREHGVADLKQVNLAVLETDGSISILTDNYKQRTNRKRKSSKTLPKSTS
ncbi:MAG: DUF421 domain-containing protein [Bacteroidetes bacterium]|nr:DUF421 domain-containing protein [Bacteroidota bacterium]HNR18846.1 DUF421 domain-containing protein [Bacteroidia bacterium]HNU32434.1 DUF421 domain-containing protein [Bacteroidia bacterium]